MQFGVSPYGTTPSYLGEVMRLEAIEKMSEAHVLHRKWESVSTTGYDLTTMGLEGALRIGDDWTDHRRTSVMWKVDAETFIEVTSSSEHDLFVEILAPSYDRAQELMATIAKNIIRSPPPPTDRVEMKFWYMTSDGPATRTREIEVPTWAAIQGNYALAAREALDRLMTRPPADLTAGRIILMHGPAGTGKTTAIRTLAHQWRRWCKFEYVIDPDELFGEHGASYLVQVVLSDPGEIELVGELCSDGSIVEEAPWRVLIMEDSEEFIRVDAKRSVGQGLARLLNIGDGLIGQGLKVMTLLTTNAEIGSLNPAVTRAGRCIADIEVPPLSPTEGQIWLADHHLATNTFQDKHLTLAELYEISRERQQIVNKAVPVKTGAYA